MKRSLKICGSLVLFILTVLAFLWVDSYKVYDGKLHAFFFEVPVGDGFVFKTPHGKLVAIDGGIDDTIISKISSIMPFWHREIELLVLTHPDVDHLNGALELLKKFPVQKILISGVHAQKREFEEFLRVAEQKNITLLFSTPRSDFKVDGVTFDTVFPERNLVGTFIKNINNSSVTMRVKYGKHSFLLAGDNEQESESEMLRLGVNLKSTILLAGHHGSKTSSSENFLKAVAPQYVIISAGPKNTFGHPHQVVLQRILALGAGIFVTKDMGDIEVVSDGELLMFL